MADLRPPFVSSPLPNPILVVSVTRMSSTVARWRFNANVTINVQSKWGLQQQANSGVWGTSAFWTQITSDIIEGTFFDTFNVGNAWRIIVPPHGVDEAASILVPQYGLIA